MNEHRLEREGQQVMCHSHRPFESRAQAAWTRAQMHDSGLRIFRCPVDPRHYHLGRIHDTFYRQKR